MQTTSSDDPVEQFRNFCENAKPYAMVAVKQCLDLIAQRATLLIEWLVPHDLLRVARLTGDENAYVELVAWALDPKTHPASALARQRGWLEHLGFGFAAQLSAFANPKTQLVTKDGRPDLVLDYRSQGHVVIIEAKTGTEEHNTPSGVPQTVSYVEAVRDSLRLAESVEVHIIFLTPDRRGAANPEAKNSTFLEFVIALAIQLSPVMPRNRERSAFEFLFTHLLNCASPDNVNATRLASELTDWSQQPGWTDDDQIAIRLNKLLLAKQIFLSEMT